MDNAAAQIVVVAATAATVAACVLLQYEYLIRVWRWLSQHTGHRRIKVLYAIVSVLLLHIVEIWIFGIVMWLLLLWPQTGGIAGAQAATLFECIYLSAASFSTVGFGDVSPVGPVRFLSGTEALSGLVLITWSASFTYIEMQRFWRPEDMGQP